MKVIYAILSIAGWIWLVVASILLWVRIRHIDRCEGTTGIEMRRGVPEMPDPQRPDRAL
jgi:hypothetical protein